MHDDGFHEIQLNGKQLVFLFMAATVVSVVIFLCGVLVGRGVRAGRGLTAEAAAADVADLRPGDLQGAVDTPPPAAEDPTTATPPPAVDELSYPDRLESAGPAVEDLKLTSAEPPPVSSAQPPAPAPVPVPAPAAAAPAAPAAPPASTPAPAPAPARAPAAATGSGFTLQVAALRDGGEANLMAERLAAKGYGAYVVPPAAGAPPVFRVRVGRYPTRREAESMAARLEREEQFTPWITR
jgi:DedD protein